MITLDRFGHGMLALCALGAITASPSALVGQSGKPAPAADLAPYFQPAGAGSIAPDADGFLRRWLLLEPIAKPNASNTGFTRAYVRQALTEDYAPGSFLRVPRDGDIVRRPDPLRWHALDSTLFDVKLFNFAQALGKRQYGVVFWAATIVTSPRAMRDVRLAVGSNSASMWWLNGRETVGLFDDRRMVMDDVVSDRVTLRKGRNVIYGAVINGPGLSDFCVRFIGEDGRPVRDLTVGVE